MNPADASARRIGSYDVYGAIEVEYDQAGGSNLFGNPVNAESDAARGGRWQAFEKGSSIYWHPNVSKGHANQVGGAIRDKWRDLGWENSTLKYPTTRELAARKPGRFNHFEGGSIYWSSNTGAHSSWGRIRDKWADKDWESGPLGYPATDEFKAKNNGAGQHFESGSVYWSGNTDAHSSWGLIRDKWAELKWENGPLGYPTTDEFKGNNNGAGQHFEGGSVYWSGNTDAHSSWGLIRDKWAELKWENGPLGYPTTDEFKVKDNGAGQHFEGGSIYWSPQGGVHAVWGAIKNSWANRNWENGRFGFPVSDEFDFDGGKAQNFQGGTIDWKSDDPDKPTDDPEQDQGPRHLGYQHDNSNTRSSPGTPDETGQPPTTGPSRAPAPSTSAPAPSTTAPTPSTTARPRPVTPSPKPPGPTAPGSAAPTTTQTHPIPSATTSSTTTPNPSSTSDPSSPDADAPKTLRLAGVHMRQDNSPDDEPDDPSLEYEPCGVSVAFPHASQTPDNGRLKYPEEIHTQVVSECKLAPTATKNTVKARTFRLRFWGGSLPVLLKQNPWKDKTITMGGYQAQKSSNSGKKIKMSAAVKCQAGTRFRYMTWGYGEFAFPGESAKLYGPVFATNPPGKEQLCTGN
ncbi:hypothetical protein [Nocardia sp. NPDC051570]|uniref:hypothetical protein n=1 Tax=Nocardia sp. NPDC051570 TaxID=3364324 RepID=UPI0037A57156